MSILSPHHLLASPPAAIFLAAPNLAPAVSSSYTRHQSKNKTAIYAPSFFRLSAAILQYASAFCVSIATPSWEVRCRALARDPVNMCTSGRRALLRIKHAGADKHDVTSRVGIASKHALILSRHCSTKKQIQRQARHSERKRSDVSAGHIFSTPLSSRSIKHHSGGQQQHQKQQEPAAAAAVAVAAGGTVDSTSMKY